MAPVQPLVERPSTGVLRALVCEDDPAVRRTIVVMMKLCGITEVTGADGAAEAVGAAAELRPDVVVIDLALAGSRGVGIVADLRAVAPNCDVIVVSPFEGLRQRALDAGALGFCGLDDGRDVRRCIEHVLSHRAALAGVCECGDFDTAGGTAAAGPVVASKRGTQWVGRQDPWSSN